MNESVPATSRLPNVASRLPVTRLATLSRLVHREVMLLAVLSGIAAGGFLLTRSAAASNRARQSSDASRWFERGTATLAAGRTAEAVIALDRAVARRPDDWPYARTLADALAADAQTDAARQVLLQWRLRRPDDGEVNTRLARLEADRGAARAAVDYYERALHGRWRETADDARLAVRRELIDFALQHGLTADALAQTLVLAANLPDQPAAHLEAGRRFLAAGDPARARDHFARHLRLAPGNRDGRAGAVAAAFALGDYARVVAQARGLSDRASQERASLAAAVVTYDPLAPRLSMSERERRLARVIDDTWAPFDACRQQPGRFTPLARRSARGLADALTAFRADLSSRRLRESSGIIERGLRLVGQAWDVVRQRCPPLDARGDALLRVAQRHGSL